MTTSDINSTKKDRVEIYDWLRGLASIAVVLGHFRPFDISKCYFVWSIHAFILVTVGLASKSTLGVTKFFRRLIYLMFVYASIAFFFWSFNLTQEHMPHVPLHSLIFNPVIAFLRNPYFDDLWYLVLHVQVLFLLLFLSKKSRKVPPLKVFLALFLLSQAIFAVTYFVFARFTSIFLPSWLFVIAIGWYAFPEYLKKIEQATDKRWLRCLGAFAVLVLYFLQPSLRGWTQISETRTFYLNTFIFFIVIYLLVEIFFLIRKVGFFQPLKKGVCFISQYTLALYVYHQGIRQIAHPTGSAAFFWALFSIASGVFAGYWIHRAFLVLDRRAIEAWGKVSVMLREQLSGKEPQGYKSMPILISESSRVIRNPVVSENVVENQGGRENGDLRNGIAGNKDLSEVQQTSR